MKFAKITFSLLAVGLLAAAPSSAFAGNGLLDGGCGCATQKGIVQNGYVHQKGVVQNDYVHQKGEIIQKGGIAQKGCAQKGCTQKGCGSSKGGGCGSCSICLPRVLPALLNGIDAVLSSVFACDSCGSSKGCGCATQKGHVVQKGYAVQKGHIAQKGSVQKGGSCDCGTSHSDHSGSNNPFIDDLQPPPVLDGDARVRVRREVARPVSQNVEHPTRSVIKTASSTSREPRALPAELVSPIEQIREARTTTQPTPASVVRTSATTASGLVVPMNPLR